MKNENLIRTSPEPYCTSCSSDGTILYSSIQDELFDVPGHWNIKQCNNQSCRLMWLDPKPIPEDIHLAYETYYTHTPLKKTLSFMDFVTHGYRAFKYHYLPKNINCGYKVIGKTLSILTFFKEHMDYPFIYFCDKKPGVMLELGVGSGTTFKQFREWGWKIDGIDFDAKAVKACVNDGLNVKHGDLLSQEFKDNYYDGIFSAHVLEHVPNPIELMSESLRILNDGGKFVAVTPNSDSALHRLFRVNWRGLEPPRHIHIFNEKSLRLAAEKAGFSKVEIITSNYSAAGVFNASYCIATGCKQSIWLRILANIARLFLTIYHYFSPMSGEELVVIAYK